MHITMERFVSDDEATIGAMRIDDRFQCFTLEDEYRVTKVPSETRIPAGTYQIELRSSGSMNERYKSKFGALHRGMLWLRDVPEFEWIYIHLGNTDQHTAGCILVGCGAMARRDNMSIQNSGDAYRALYTKVADAAENKNLTITIIDRDTRDTELIGSRL